MTASIITDDMLDRHAARGAIAADQFRRGDGPASEAEVIRGLITDSQKMARADGFADKGLIGFLALGALCSYRLRLMDTAGGAT